MQTDPTSTAVAPAESRAELVAVRRDGDGVVIHFGHRRSLGDGALGAAVQHRVALGSAGAAQLQDMLTALLQGAAPPRA